MLQAVRRHPRLAAAFALAAAVALWLLVEVAWGVIGWHGREHEPLAPWMTVGYVGRTHDVSPRLIDEAAGFPTPQEAGHALTLAEIAARRGVPVEDVFADVEDALARLRAQHGPGGRGGPEPGRGSGAAGPTPPGGATPADGPAE